jgi:hypothetical protein
MQVRAAEAELRNKLFQQNAWMKVFHFNALTSCPKDELDQWFIGLYGEHIIPASCTVAHKGSRRGSHVYEINAWQLAVKLWQAPASSGWPFGRQDRMDLQ